MFIYFFRRIVFLQTNPNGFSLRIFRAPRFITDRRFFDEKSRWR